MLRARCYIPNLGTSFCASPQRNYAASFYNRTKEVDLLYGSLKDAPKFSVIGGPVHSGKSALMSEVLSRIESEKPRPAVLRMNLRSMTFRDVESFSDTIASDLQSWYQRFIKTIGAVEGQVKVSDSLGNEVSASASLGKPISAQNHMKSVYSSISRALPDWSWLRGKGIPPPILFIDEANRLEALLQDERGNALLNDFFAWIVQNTKETNKFHIVMASSDSFFFKWICQFVDSGSFRYLFVGHLSQQESKDFWERVLFNSEHFVGFPPLSFEEAYKYCGGCIHLLDEAYSLYRHSKGSLTPERMSHVSIRMLKFTWALKTKHVSEELLDVMKSMLESKHHCVSYDKLCDMVSKEKIDFLIRKNLVHFVPRSDFNFITPYLAIIMPYAPCDVPLMEFCLSRQSNR